MSLQIDLVWYRKRSAELSLEIDRIRTGHRRAGGRLLGTCIADLAQCAKIIDDLESKIADQA